MAFLEQKKGIIPNLAERQRLAPGQSMPLRESGKKRFAEEFLGQEFVTANRQRQNGHINVAIVQAIKQNRRDLFHDADGYRVISSGEARQHRSQKIWCDRGNRADDHRSHFGSGHLLNLGTRLAHLAQNFAGLGQKGFSEIGETREARKAIEELGAEFVFKLADLLGERWLRDMLFLGRSRKVSGASDGAEISQLMQFHSVYFDFRPKSQKLRRLLRCVSPMNSIEFIY